MPKKKPIDTNEPHPDVPPMPARGREVVYTIVVPNCTDRVKIEHARLILHKHNVRPALIDIDDVAGVVSVKRLTTTWQGDEAEQSWQRTIQAALPGALIDVAEWTPASGFPKGELGTIEGATK